MAITAWPSMTAGDITSGVGAETLGLSLWDRDRVIEQVGATFYVATQTGLTDTTATTQDSVVVLLPEWVISGRVIRVRLNITQTGGGTSHFRIQDNASATAGTEVTSAIAGQDLESVLTAASGWAGTQRTINVQVWKSGAAASVGFRSDTFFGNMRFGDA